MILDDAEAGSEKNLIGKPVTGIRGYGTVCLGVAVLASRTLNGLVKANQKTGPLVKPRPHCLTPP